ncbi:MAG: hypothetical protein A3K19_21160 [Lentisphaerae bacterium RIFOXYB12_FULL_65_16]|nr:MAG: hypothetical protein A3K18_21265 [Lentisphaerae bacterium RIFOXYA12_64_32]OGV93990.1 MAG: hypothetical protein A3K19_21160 [Lentisphaerae bacterium RIFOXYB12_FULL_65_16]
MVDRRLRLHRGNGIGTRTRNAGRWLRWVGAALGLVLGVVDLRGADADPAGGAATAGTPDLFRFDFEQAADFAACTGLEASQAEARLVDGGPTGTGKCLELRNRTPGWSCPLELKLPLTVTKNLVLTFDHKETIENGEGENVAIAPYYDEKNSFWVAEPFSNEWRHAEIAFGALPPSSAGATVTLGLVLPRISVYARAKNKDTAKATITMHIDNIRIGAGERQSVLTDRTRVSYSAVPMFNWPVPTTKVTGVRLQYAQDAAFPGGAAVTVDVPVSRNFFAPAAPLARGTWYWRVWQASDLAEGWSDIQRIVIPPEAHTFVLPPVDLAALAQKPHPRFLPLAMLDRGPVDKAECERMVVRVKSLREQGVPPDPPPYPGKTTEPGKGPPEWPNWIDWYGRIADETIARTGGRLRDAAKCAMLSGDAQAKQWVKELLLEACKWDPKGGSMMSRCDLQSGWFMEGMSWCYDAAYDVLTPEERMQVRAVLVERAEQFDHHVRPFRGNEAQNHPWHNTQCLMECAVALLGEHEPAADWLEFGLELFAYRFVACMGYDGDNNEGLSYWSFGTGMLADVVDLARAVCGADLYKQPWFAKTARYAVYCAPPGGWNVAFGDVGAPNHGIVGPYGVPLALRLGRRTSDAYALWYAGATAAVDGTAPKPPVDIPASIHHRQTGWVLFNTTLADGRENVALSMHSGVFIAGHQHPDQNSFTINAYGEKLAIDGGYYDWYGSRHFNEYSFTTLAHNTLLVNGKGQAVRKDGADGLITAYHDAPGYAYTVGDASDPEIYASALKRFDRRLLFIKPGFVMVHDLVATAGGPATLDWLIHSHTSETIRTGTEGGMASFAIEAKNAHLLGRFVAPATLDETVTHGYPVAPQHKRKSEDLPTDQVVSEWTLKATPKEAREKEEFLAVMQVRRMNGEQDDPVAVLERLDGPTTVGVRIQHGRSAHVVVFRKQDAAGVLAAGEIETDGDAAAVEVSAAGEVARAFAANAKFLRFRGQALLERAESATWSECWVPKPEAGPIEGAWLEVAGTRAPLAGHASRSPACELRTWWAPFTVPKAGRYRLEFAGWTGKKLLPWVFLDGKVVDSPAPDAPDGFVVRLKSEPHLITLTGQGAMEGLRISRVEFPVVSTTALPKEFQPPAACLKIEAEVIAREGHVTDPKFKPRAKVADKVGASGGKAHCFWDDEGYWAEWDFEVAQEGDYELLIRAAGDQDDVVRRVQVDGKPVVEPDGVVSFASTGGWCRTTDDWRYFAVQAKAGGNARLHLAAGKHTLRLEELEGSANLDVFVLQPAGAR